MPAYANSAFQVATLVQRGVPCYLFGSYNYKQDNTRMLVSNVALTTNVATLTVQITCGEVPKVGSLISVQQTASTSGTFNVNRVALTGVTIDATTGAGTVTFALTHANVASAADTGAAVVEVPEVGETLANGKSAPATVPFVLPFNDGMGAQTVVAVVAYPSIPTAATVKLQGAIHDNDAEYVDVATVSTVTGGSVQSTSASFTGKFNYYRFSNTGVSGGTNPTIVAKILL